MENMEFGEYIRTLRKEKELSQFQLGKLIGVSDKAVSKWENGCARPKAQYILRLSELLGVSTSDLLQHMQQ